MERTNKPNADVRDVLLKEIEDLGRSLEAFPWEDPRAYATFMAQTYFIVRNTTHFLGLAAARAPNRETHYAMIHHLKEELNHDLVALKDVKTLGYTPDDFVEFTETRLLVQTQYYWLEYGPAVSLMGYALCLEGLATLAGPKILKRLAGGPAAHAVAFLELHVKVDEEHFPEGLKMLDSMSESDREAVRQNMTQSSLLYKQMLAKCRENASALRPFAPKTKAA